MLNNLRIMRLPLVLQRVNRLHTKYAGEEISPVFTQCGYCKSFKFNDAPKESKWYSKETFARLQLEVKRELNIKPLISHGICQPCENIFFPLPPDQTKK